MSFWEGFEKQAITGKFIGKRVMQRIADYTTDPVQKTLLHKYSPVRALINRRATKLYNKALTHRKIMAKELGQKPNIGKREFAINIQKELPKKMMSPADRQAYGEAVVRRKRFEIGEKDRAFVDRTRPKK